MTVRLEKPRDRRQASALSRHAGRASSAADGNRRRRDMALRHVLRDVHGLGNRQSTEGRA